MSGLGELRSLGEREGHEHTCSTVRSSCQTRALNPDARGGVPGQSDIRVAWPAGNVPVSRPA